MMDSRSEYRHLWRVGQDFEPALAVLATVMGTPTPDRVIVDAGMKARSIRPIAARGRRR